MSGQDRTKTEPPDFWDSATRADDLINFVTAQKALRATVTVFLLLSLALFLRTVWNADHLRRGSTQDALAGLSNRLQEAAIRIDEELRNVRPVAVQLAERLSNGEVPAGGLDEALRTALGGVPETADPLLSGLGVAEVPAGNGRANSYLYASRAGRRIRVQTVADNYAVVETRNQWYYDTLLDGPTWYEPFYHRATEQLVAGFATPFFSRDGGQSTDEPAGVVFTTLDLRRLQEHIGSLGLGTYGYSFLFTRQGNYLVDPQLDDEPGERPTIFERAWREQQRDLAAMAVRAVRNTDHGAGEVLDVVDPKNRESGWILHQPIPTSSWTLAAKALQRDFQPGNDDLRRAFLNVVLTSLLVFVFCGAVRVLRQPTQTFVSAWFGVLGSIVLVAAIGAVWFMTYLYPEPPEDEQQGDGTVPASFKLTSRDVMEHYLDLLAWDDLREDEPVFVPTGVFVQSVEFVSSVNVKVTGYIWQRYANDEPGNDLRREIVLPEADETVLHPAYQQRDGDSDLVGWFFQATLRQHFDYQKYPSDRQHVRLRLWPADFEKNVVLVPDFESYPDINPAAEPGVEHNLVLPGLAVQQSFFSYRLNTYTTNFGIEGNRGRGKVPELYFNIEFRRNFLEPLVSRVIPVLVCMVILYVLVLTFKEEGETSRFGFSVTTIVRGCAGLFFVVIFHHITLRNNFPSPTILYFENFYYSLYFMMVLVLGYAALFASIKKMPLLHMGDHYFAKLAYWPLILIFLLVQTLVVFY